MKYIDLSLKVYVPSTYLNIAKIYYNYLELILVLFNNFKSNSIIGIILKNY